MNHSEPIVRRKLSDEVAVRLKNLVVSGILRPGDEMPSERELIGRFGVGRPAIREAMQALANMGLVAVSHGERARVLKLTAQRSGGKGDQSQRRQNESYTGTAARITR